MVTSPHPLDGLAHDGPDCAFACPTAALLPADAVERAYFSGLDEIPWRSRTQWTDEGLTLRRSEDDSGNFHIPWIVSGHGELSLQTGCLIERDEPYHLAVELARGTVHRIRNQLAIWQSVGIAVGKHSPLLSKSLELLSKAATTQHEPAQARRLPAEQALSTALDLITPTLAHLRRKLTCHPPQAATRSTTALGINLGSVAFGEAVGRYVVDTDSTLPLFHSLGATSNKSKAGAIGR